MAGDRNLDDIYQAIGRLSAGVEEAHRQNNRLEKSLDDGIRRLEVTVKEMIQEVRERYHDKANDMMKKVLEIDTDFIALKRSVDALERWRIDVDGTQAEIKTSLNDIKNSLVLIGKWQATQTANMRWILGISNSISGAIGAGVAVLVEYFRH